MMCALYFGVIALNSNDTHSSRDDKIRAACARKTTMGLAIHQECHPLLAVQNDVSPVTRPPRCAIWVFDQVASLTHCSPPEGNTCGAEGQYALQRHANTSQPPTPIMQLGQAERETVYAAVPRAAFQCVQEYLVDTYELLRHIHDAVPGDPGCKSTKQLVHVLRAEAMQNTLQRRVKKLISIASYKTMGANLIAPTSTQNSTHI